MVPQDHNMLTSVTKGRLLTVAEQEMKMGGAEAFQSQWVNQQERVCVCVLACACVRVFFLITLPEENAERIMLDPTSRENLKFKDLLKVDGDLVHSQESHPTWQCLVS